MTNTTIKNKETVTVKTPETNGPHYVLPNDPNRAMQDMMGTIDRLRLALVAETNALKDTDTQTFMSLQDQKLEVARDYLEGMAQMLSRKDELQNADPTLKMKLEKMRSEFSETAQENHAALDRMKNGMKRLGDRIMEKARETAKREEQIIYGANGHMQSSLKATMGLNESV